jgi:3-methyladenine DNA glycosylase AlkD
METKGIDQIIEEAINSENQYETIDSIIKEFIQNCLDQENHYEDKIYNKGLGYARATGGLTALIIFAIQKAIQLKKQNDELLCNSRNS